MAAHAGGRYGTLDLTDGGTVTDDLDTGVSGLLAGPTAPCVAPARSNVPYEYGLDAMFDHIVRWVRQGIHPPAGPRIEITDTTTRPAIATRDAYQNIQGGIRLAAVAAPTERAD